METILYILGILAAIFLIIIVLVQNPKGGGLASNFASSNSVLGVQKTTELTEKLTWIFAAVILVVSLWVTMISPRATDIVTDQETISTGLEDVDNLPAPAAQPAPGAQGQGAPAGQGQPPAGENF